MMLFFLFLYFHPLHVIYKPDNDIFMHLIKECDIMFIMRHRTVCGLELLLCLWMAHEIS